MPTWPNRPAESYLAALSDPDPRARQRAAVALAALRDPRAVALLIASLRADESVDVRAVAAQALGKIGDPSAIEPLIVALRDTAGVVRERAVVALEQLGDSRAASAIIPLIEDPDPSVRYDATRAAAKLGGALAVGPLMRALRDPERGARDPTIGDPSVNAALYLIGEPARAPLLDALQDTDPTIRALAARALSCFTDDQTFDALTAAARHDPNPFARQTASHALDMAKTARAYARAKARPASRRARPTPATPTTPVSAPIMPAPIAPPHFDWPGLMIPWNAELLADEEIRADLPSEVIASGWLGYPGASEEQLTTLEARLGAALPPSYRAFLAFSNGWRATGHFIPTVWNTDEVEWHAVRNQELIDAWRDGERYDRREPDPVPDGEYLDYSGDHGAAEGALRSEYLQTALEVSDHEVAGSAVYLLNPQTVTPEGEWEAWFFAAWIPGATRYRSFWELMVAEHASYLALRDT
jgi:hypothetical protein